MISIVLAPSKGLFLLYCFLWGGSLGLIGFVLSQMNGAYSHMAYLAFLALMVLLTGPFYLRRYVLYRHSQAIVKMDLNIVTDEWFLTSQSGKIYPCQLKSQSIAIRLGALLLFETEDMKKDFFVPILASQCPKIQYCQLLRWWHGYEN